MMYEVCCSSNNIGVYVTVHSSSPLLLSAILSRASKLVDVAADGLDVLGCFQNSRYL
jgi:hypothetical protein